MEVGCFYFCQVIIMKMEPRVTQRTQFSKEGGVNPATLSSQSSLRGHNRQISLVSLSTITHLLQHKSFISHCSTHQPDQQQPHLWPLNNPCPRILLKHNP